MRQAPSSFCRRFLSPLVLAIAVSSAACGDGKALIEPSATRYNFGIVDGANQSSVAGAAELPQPITSQLTKDPAGKFATRLKNFVLPIVAYAQGLTMPGEPVAGALVCAREAGPGEPTAFPLCAFTLANGKAPIEIKGGTKAGVHQVVFSAQVQSQQPVKDSTTVTVAAGPVATHHFHPGTGYTCWIEIPADRIRDQYGNPVPYRFVTTGPLAHVADTTLGSAGARTFVVDRRSVLVDGGPWESQPVTVEVVPGSALFTGRLDTRSGTCVDLYF
ncbi:MAG: hypothetical protein ACSLFE_00430 [Gemmatimonadaceae bacterium]